MACAAAPCGSAAVFGQSDDFRNAATWYQRSFERMDGLSISPDDWQALRRYVEHPTATPPEQVRSLLMTVQPVLSAVRRGTRQEYSDFQLQYSFDLQLPHLSQMSNIGRLMSAEAMIRLHDGNPGRAADDVASLYRLADHVGGDDVIISSLVGQAIFETADRAAQAALDRGAFGPVEAGKLREAMAGLETKDPFNLINAMDSERLMTVDWMRRNYADPEDRASMLDQMTLNTGAGAELAGLAMMDDTHFEAALDGLEQVQDRVVEAFSMDDPVEARLELEQLAAEVERGEHGVLAQLLAPAYGKLYDRMTEAHEQIARRTAELDAIITGVVSPDQLANAAVWYIRAAELVGAIPSRRRAHFQDIAANPALPVEHLAGWNDDGTEAVVEVLRQATRIEHCDFSNAGGGGGIVPDYLAGLREAAYLLDADAVRLWQQDKAAEAAERLAMCYRMATHLSGAGALPVSLVAHQVFIDTDRLARKALEWGTLTDAQRPPLLAAAESMSAKDPFGYITAHADARGRILQWADRWASQDAEARRRSSGLVQQIDGDQLLYLLVVIVEFNADADRTPIQLQVLDDVMSLENLFVAQGQAAAARDRIIAARDLSIVLADPVPQIGSVQERFSKARSDHRAALAALREN